MSRDTWGDEAEIAVVKGSWEDEDEHDVKDSWDAEEEEEKPAKLAAQPTRSTTSTKNLHKTTPASANNDDEDDIDETEIERKQRIERLQKESDLEAAIGLFGISKSSVNVDEILGSAPAPRSAKGATSGSSALGAFESLQPSTQAEFDQLATMIVGKVEKFGEHKLYPHFLENICRGLLINRDVPEVRKVAGILNDLATNKQREKLAIAKKKPAASLAGAKKGSRMDFNDYGDVYDDFD